MKAMSDVQGINNQIVAVAARIAVLTEGINCETGITDGVKALYEDQVIDEVGHLQKLVLELSKQIYGDQPDESAFDEGESAFAEGELTSELGEKKKLQPGEKRG